MIKKQIIKLIDVKSIVTLSLTFVFCYQTIIGSISSSDYLSIFTVIIAFYFGTQYQKKREGDKNE